MGVPRKWRAPPDARGHWRRFGRRRCVGAKLLRGASVRAPLRYAPLPGQDSRVQGRERHPTRHVLPDSQRGGQRGALSARRPEHFAVHPRAEDLGRRACSDPRAEARQREHAGGPRRETPARSVRAPPVARPKGLRRPQRDHAQGSGRLLLAAPALLIFQGLPCHAGPAHRPLPLEARRLRVTHHRARAPVAHVRDMGGRHAPGRHHPRRTVPRPRARRRDRRNRGHRRAHHNAPWRDSRRYGKG
mmetsp:Transcript_26400/g.70541  ORF Transcript_26400/g.70541 Transcript_26400/m.70541 type:complete len:245 (+) Transcript_26400:514-1248(+)